MSDGELAVQVATEVGVARSAESRVGLEEYYSEAGPDYAAWSPRYNMHFGYFDWGLNPFRREPMLERMNTEVMNRLRLDASAATNLLDMGCGVGATLRSFARRLPLARLTGITLVPWQIERGVELNKGCDVQESIRLIHGDYEHTPLDAGSMDAVYALESSCHAHGADKGLLLEEAHRVLQSEGRLVIVDGFLEGSSRMRGLQRRIYRKLCECWVIDTLGDLSAVTAKLAALGFGDIKVERIQFRVAPSVFHIPWVTAKFLVTDVLFGRRRMTRARWNNVIAPALLPLVSWPLGPMIYCMVSATKR